jgi:hypothetical protein
MDPTLPSTRATPSLGALVVWWIDFLVRFGLVDSDPILGRARADDRHVAADRE